MLYLRNFVRNKKKYKIIVHNYGYFSTNLYRHGQIIELAAAYKPLEIESISGNTEYFFPKTPNKKQRFSMILPPPNITGTLHLGHALTVTIQDVLVKWNRMQGVDTVWVPGIDHAGIATQVVVEKRLWKETHQTRHDLGRKLFQDEVWRWKEQKAEVIGQQLRRLGVSLDWYRDIFTMDPKQQRAVNEAFVRLFDAGLIYRADRLVNWSCALRSAISDIEVDHVEVAGRTTLTVPGYKSPIDFGVLTSFAYKLADNESEEIVVATTRPETILGDVAVAVHPRDDRYNRYVGRKLWHPLRNETIPIICDECVDPEFGTGAVKVTPAHNHLDFELATKHNLPLVQVFDERGVVIEYNSTENELRGMKRFELREKMLSILVDLNLLRGTNSEHRMTVPICSRSGDVIEFLLRPQWFVRCQKMAENAAEALKDGRLRIEPERFGDNWLNWMENMRDWCISRQLWWGHQIPAYICHTPENPESPKWIAAASPEIAQCKANAIFSTTNTVIKQDEDVLDTWFSSALLPFSSFGWPEKSADLEEYYPLNLMETGHDILFFWVARMVMLGMELTAKVPFERVLLHSVLCDANGKKMSKSLGNVVLPEDVISGASLQTLEEGSKENHKAGILSEEELQRAVRGQKKMFPDGIPECGADALRFTLCSHDVKSHFINFDVQECHTNKLFGNKIWQATKYTNNWANKYLDALQKGDDEAKSIDIGTLSVTDRWIMSRLTEMVQISTRAIENFEFHHATGALKKFLYYEFCDIYLETTKHELRMGGEKAVGHCRTLCHSLDVGLRCLAPFMPHLAAHLHQHLLHKNANKGQLQGVDYRDVVLEEEMGIVMDIVVGIRRLKKLFSVTAKHNPKAYVLGDLERLSKFSETIRDLSSCETLEVTKTAPATNLSNCSLVQDRVRTEALIYLQVPEELCRAFALDQPKTLAKKEKLLKELARLEKMVTGTNYRSKALPEAQKEHAKKIAVLEEKIARIDYIQSITRIQ